VESQKHPVIAVAATLEAVLKDVADIDPVDLDPGLLDQAEQRLVAEAGRFGPRQLRILGRRIPDVLAPEVAEGFERRALETRGGPRHGVDSPDQPPAR
jgi:hypothetical protein